MADSEIRFDDGAGYERFMGKWSRLAGEQFLNWLKPDARWRWLDVGCGNGAFTELIVALCDPRVVHGIDPSEQQLAFARARFDSALVHLQRANAMALPFDGHAFDAAVMPLVIFFVPVPAKGVDEMVRVVRPGGIVSAYAWDVPGGGFPYNALWEEMRAAGIEVPQPPSNDASRIEVMQELWTVAGLTDVETRQIAVQRTFTDFDDYWGAVLCGPNSGRLLATLSLAEQTAFQSRLRDRLTAASDGRITISAWANAVKGRVAMG